MPLSQVIYPHGHADLHVLKLFLSRASNLANFVTRNGDLSDLAPICNMCSLDMEGGSSAGGASVELLRLAAASKTDTQPLASGPTFSFMDD